MFEDKQFHMSHHYKMADKYPRKDGFSFVIGTNNLIELALDARVEKIVF